jgi:hypothetical protein
VRTKEPITEGFVSLLEPFIDTVVICTMTALVIVITGVLIMDPDRPLCLERGRAHRHGRATSAACSSPRRPSAATISWFPYILALAVVLFAFSTMISWSYYGLKAWTYMFGEGKVAGADLQADLLRLRGDRRGDESRPGDRLLRRRDLRDGAGQHLRPLLPDVVATGPKPPLRQIANGGLERQSD